MQQKCDGENGIAQVDLERFYAEFGDALVNRRSTTWCGLSDAERSEDSVSLLIRAPTLMKRPVIDGSAGLTLGWDAKVQAKWLATRV